MTEESKVSTNNTTFMFSICNTYAGTGINELPGVIADFHNIVAFSKKYLGGHVVKPNMTYDQIDATVDTAIKRIKELPALTRVIFHYSGHGYQKTSAGELMPGMWTNDSKPVSYSVIVQKLARKLKEFPNKIVSLYMFIDACRTNIESGSLDYSPIPMDAFVSVLFLYAARPNITALEIRSGGYFTTALIECLSKYLGMGRTENVLNALVCMYEHENKIKGKMTLQFNANKYVRENHREMVDKLLKLSNQSITDVAVTMIGDKAQYNLMKLAKKCPEWIKILDGYIKVKKQIEELDDAMNAKYPSGNYADSDIYQKLSALKDSTFAKLKIDIEKNSIAYVPIFMTTRNVYELLDTVIRHYTTKVADCKATADIITQQLQAKSPEKCNEWVNRQYEYLVAKGKIKRQDVAIKSQYPTGNYENTEMYKIFTTLKKQTLDKITDDIKRYSIPYTGSIDIATDNLVNLLTTVIAYCSTEIVKYC